MSSAKLKDLLHGWPHVHVSKASTSTDHEAAHASHESTSRQRYAWLVGGVVVSGVAATIASFTTADSTSHYFSTHNPPATELAQALAELSFQCSDDVCRQGLLAQELSLTSSESLTLSAQAFMLMSVFMAIFHGVAHWSYLGERQKGRRVTWGGKPSDCV
jgi:hypothetical protein